MGRLTSGFVLTIIVATIVLSASRAVEQLSWTCPVCHQDFSFDARDADYLRRWSANHLASHGSAPSSDTHGTSPAPVPVSMIEDYRQARAKLDRVTSSRLPEF